MAKSQTPKKNQNTKYIAFGALIVALVAVLYYNLQDDTPQPPTDSTAQKSTPTPGRVFNKDLPSANNDPFAQNNNDNKNIVKTANTTDSKKSGQVITAAMIQPVRLELVHQGIRPIEKVEGDRGNIFNYWVAPPVPPPPPPPPPPIPPVTVSSLQPSSVYARTGGFTMKVYGEKFQPDSQAVIGGMPFKTKFVSDKELSIEIPTSAIQVAGQRNVEVQSKIEGFKVSSVQIFNIIPPPTPPYRYVGLIVNGGDSLAVLIVDNNNAVNVRIGDKVEKNGRWVVRTINNQRIEFEDTELRLLHAVPFTGDH